ncbi:MAG: tetratricopeptide repeat protein [Victivallales bacterium]|nr:tetratricopeptide repeat protein [Victivallales bacterium]
MRIGSEEKRKVGKKLLLAVCSSLFLFSANLLAIDEFALDLEFIRALGEIEFSDYVQMQLQQMSKKYPDKKDAIGLETARYYYNTGKVADADKIINAFPKTSEFYTDAVLLKAEAAFARKRLADADKAYKEYFTKIPTAPQKGKAAKNEFKRAVMLYSRVLKEMGKGKEAADILSKLEGMDGMGGDDRQMDFLKLQATIDAEANKLEDHKPIDVKGLNETLTKLKSLQFVRDGAGASAYLQYARGQILLGRNAANNAMRAKKPADCAKINNFKEAIKTIKMADSFLEEMENTMPKNERATKSPVAEAMYYKALAIYYQGVATHFSGNAELGKKQVLGAAKYLEALLENYPDTVLRKDIMLTQNDCSRFAEKMYQEKIEISQGDGGEAIDLKIEQAQTLFANGDYQNCIPIYLEAVRAGRRSRKLPNVVMRLSIAYAQLDMLDHAEALVSYVADAMPKEAGSADAAYRLGGILFERSRKEQNPLRKNELQARAINVWDLFVKLDPAHQKAPDVAFAVAELQYQKGSELVAKSNQEKDTAKKQALQQQAIQAFYDAIPLYQRLTEVFSAFDKGIRAYYKLGWIYHTINTSPKELVAGLKDKYGAPLPETNFAQLGTEAFNSYYEEEADTSNERSDDRLQAKFRAAELSLYGDSPLDALPHLQEIVGLFQGGKGKEKGINVGTAKAKGILEDAMAYMPWAYDLAGEKERQPIVALKEQQETFRSRSRAAKRSAEQAKGELTALAKQKEELAEEEKNIAQIVFEASLDFQAMAKEQMKERIAKMESMPAAEKQREQQEINNEIQNRLAGLEQQKVDTLKGDQTSIDESLPLLENSKAEFERALESAKASETEQKNSYATLKASLEKQAKEYKALSDEISKVEREAVDAEAEKQRLEADNDNAEALAAAMKRLEVAYKEKAEKASPEILKKAEDMEKNLMGIKLEEADAAEGLKTAAFAVKANALRLEIANTRIEVTKRRKNLNAKTLDAMAKKGDERKVTISELQKLASSLKQAQDKLSAKSNEFFKLWEDEIQRRIKNTDEQVKAADGELAAMEEKIKPIQEKVNEMKKLAINEFIAFDQKYPKSAKSPNNLARLGTIYIDLGQNEEASKALEKLAVNFPDSDANKKARFNLGRAQLDANKFEEAAKTFTDLFANKGAVEALDVANLSYMLDAGLKMKASDVTIKSAARLLSIAQNKATADKVPMNIRDKAYARGAEAYLAKKEYANAVKYVDDLLAKNQKTAYYYDVKFISADAKAALRDTDGAEKDLEEILQFSTDAAITNKALCQLAEALSKDPAKEQLALARYQLVALLGDVTNEESRPWIEKACLGYAELLKKNGKMDELAKLAEKYKKDFPGGKHAAAITRLLK